MKVTPHVVQITRHAGCSAIDGRTKRHRGYAMNQRRRKCIDQSFGLARASALRVR